MINSPRARALGAELRAARKAKGMSQELLAEQLGWSNATISRMETSKTGVSESDVSAFLAVLRIRGEKRERLLRMARELNQPAWWEIHRGLPTQMRALIDAEQRANRITAVSISYVPGLLQTRAYSRGIFAVGDQTDHEIEEAVAVRQSRQGILDKTNPVEFLAYVDEAVLLRPVGGEVATAEQLRHVLKAVQRDNISVQVLPLSLGAHMGLDGSFTLLEFPRDERNVNIEAANSGVMLADPDDLVPFQQTLVRLAEVAMTEEESVQLIADYAARFESEA